MMNASTDAGPLPRLPRRARDVHKGVCGTVAVIGGCDQPCSHDEPGSIMLGAPCLAALAALRAGCGLARLVMPAHLLPHALTVASAATGIPLPVDEKGALIPHECAVAFDLAARTCDAVVVGPGLGRSEGASTLSLRAIQHEDATIVVDADAINSLAATPDFHKEIRAACIFTPHPGEFKRLCRALGQTDDLGLAQSRAGAAERLAQRLGAIVVLKGAGTVVSDGHATWTCAAGHPCLATAGSGDVLAGIIAGIAAQFVTHGLIQPLPQIAALPENIRAAAFPGGSVRSSNTPFNVSLFDAVRIAVDVHARCGELWARQSSAESGLIATDLLDLIPFIAESAKEADKP